MLQAAERQVAAAALRLEVDQARAEEDLVPRVRLSEETKEELAQFLKERYLGKGSAISR